MPSELMFRGALFPLLLIFVGCSKAPRTSTVSSPPPDEIVRLDLNPFYKKFHTYRGLPIVGSSQVHDEAFLEAAHLMEKMLGHRPDIVEAMRTAKVRVAIMAPTEYTTDVPEHSNLEPKVYWDKRARGLGATRERPAVSVGEENLLGFRGDPYAAESIFVHEFAHALHHMGLNLIDPEFQGQLETAFNRASLEGLWRGKYAGTNPAEYWAEGVQSWFGTNRENDHDHNHVNSRAELRAHDSELAKLVESVFGDGEWRYRSPASRYGTEHLANVTQDAFPVFSWPSEMVRAYEAYQAGEGRLRVPLELDQEKRPSASERSSNQVSLRFENQTKEVMTISWLDFSGKLSQATPIDPGRNHQRTTYEGHIWVITDASGEESGWFATPASDGIAMIE